MVRMMNQIIEAGGTTAHLSTFDDARMISHYISPPLLISCNVAVEGDEVLGFQALEWCDPNWDGPGKLPSDWAVIASFVSGVARGCGVGRALFAKTMIAAHKAGVSVIDATIRADNELGLGYYSAIGFKDYDRLKDIPLSDGTKVDRIRKRFDL